MADPSFLRRWLPTTLLKLSAGLHVAGVAALAAAPRSWPFVLSTLFADHMVITGSALWPRSRLLGPNMTALPLEDARAGRVALTFDDGPDAQVTPEVLSILDRYAAKASFFCIGRHAEAEPELVAEIVRRGHRVENHSYRHSNAFSFLGPRALGREVDRAQRVLGELSGCVPQYFRAPAGIRGPWLEAVLAPRGLRLVSWTRRAFDTVTGDVDKVVARLARGVTAGDVLLLHDGSAAGRSRRRPVVIDALPRLLDELTSRELRSVALPVRSTDSTGSVVR